MKMIKIISFISLLSLSVPFASADYTEINCSTDKAFTENSCNQCFEWWAKSVWDNIGLMTDLWINDSDKDKILYKEEQEMPRMINLDSWNVNWAQTPESAWFWEYTKEFDSLYSDKEEWYILKTGTDVVWLKSKLGYAYNLAKNSVVSWWNIGLLVYPIISHNIMAEWDITIDSTEHRECVLFTSWTPSEKKIIIKKEEPKKLPETWPEHVLLVILAMILWFGLVRLTKKA